jgi:hypothetical protein
MASRADFLRALFPDPKEDEWVNIRVLPSKAQAFGTPGDPELDAFLQAHATENLYFGVASRVERNGQLTGGAENCHRVYALWCDFDFKDTPEDNVRAVLAVCGVAPSVVVHSGGGLHVYWLLKDAIPADAVLGTWLRRLARTLKADLASAEPARILRLPDTLNYKYDPPRPVVVERCEPTRQYALSDFEWLHPEPMRQLARSPIDSYSVGVVNPAKVVETLAALWPTNGQRHMFAKHLGGWFASRSVNQDSAEQIIHDAADAAGDDDPADRVRVVRDTYLAHAVGKSVTGLHSALAIVPALRDVVGGLTEALGIVPRPLTTADEASDDATEPDDLRLPDVGRIGLAKRWADLYAEAFESPWENFYFAFLTHLGARVAKHLRLDDDLGTEPRLYSVLLGASGIGKSEPMNKAEADFAWADLGHVYNPATPEPGRLQVVHGVGSGEALAEALEAADKRQLILQPDEFSHVMNKAKIDGGSLIQILLTLFEKATFDNRTKGKTYQLEGASLSFLTACVDTVFPTLFDPKGGADSGIINRFWIVAGPSSREPKPTPRVNRTTLDEVRLALHRLLVPFKRMTPQQQVLVRLTPDAEALYRDWYRNEYFPMKDDPAAARLRTYACRLIMLGAVTTLPQPRQLGPGGELVAGPEAVLAALTMVRWQYRVRRQFSPIIAECQRRW